jgi:hypothetical protein
MGTYVQGGFFLRKNPLSIMVSENGRSENAERGCSSNKPCNPIYFVLILLAPVCKSHSCQARAEKSGMGRCCGKLRDNHPAKRHPKIKGKPQDNHPAKRLPSSKANCRSFVRHGGLRISADGSNAVKAPQLAGDHTARDHPFPSRTRKLSLAGPMVLHGQPCGRLGDRRH